MEEYRIDNTSDFESVCEAKDVHYWRPPCSCGVELGRALEIENPQYEERKESHS